MADQIPAKKKAPAGWYDDPKLVNTRRYWDGDKWTEERLEVPRADATTPATPGEHQQAKEDTTRGCLLWVGIVVVVIIVWTVIASLTGGEDKPDRGVGDRYGAEDVCKQAVKSRLKAPATAKFSATQATLSGQTWTVTGAVDSENSFGALIRGNFTCQANHEVDENWTTRNVTLLP